MKEKEITKEWLDRKGFKSLMNVSYNTIEVRDDTFLCVDIDFIENKMSGTTETDVCISLFQDGYFVHLDLYTKKELKVLYKLLTGIKLKTIK